MKQYKNIKIKTIVQIIYQLGLNQFGGLIVHGRTNEVESVDIMVVCSSEFPGRSGVCGALIPVVGLVFSDMFSFILQGYNLLLIESEGAYNVKTLYAMEYENSMSVMVI